MVDPLALLWYWRHHALHVAEFCSLSEALSAATTWQEDGQAVADHIELWDSLGESYVLSGDRLAEMIRELQEERDAAADAAPRLPVVARLVIEPPVGIEGGAISKPFTSHDQVEKEADRLRSYLGGRVKVVPA